jgi:hypothetical protein
VYLYGALALAPHDRDGSPRERAFRFIADHESRHATPLLLIRVSHAPLAPGRTQVQFYSAAPGWLYGAALFGDDANGRATDEHIRAFSRLVAQVADLPAAERSARLAIEGRGPGRVVARLRDVLGEVLGANPEVEGLEFAPGNAR